MSTINSSAGFSVCKAPRIPNKEDGVKVFLAGSIEQNKASDWQTVFTSALSDLPVTVFNPRRDYWDPTWEQDISNQKFKEQVVWELDRLNEADAVALFFEPGTMSPISLLELGLYASSGKLVVCCPDGYWRRGNVQVVCDQYGILLVETMEELKEHTRKRLEEAIKNSARHWVCKWFEKVRTLLNSFIGSG